MVGAAGATGRDARRISAAPYLRPLPRYGGRPLGVRAQPLQVTLSASGAVLSLEAQAVSALLATRRPDIVPPGCVYESLREAEARAPAQNGGHDS